MKIFEIYQRVLTEETISEPLYHGSKYPQILFAGQDNDYGRNLFGYGKYLTTNIYEAIEYGLGNGDNAEGYLYTVSLSNVNIVNFYDPVSDGVKNKLLADKNFYNLFEVRFNINDFDFDDYYYQIGDIMYEWDYFGEEKQLKLLKFNGLKEVFERPVSGPEEMVNIIKQNNDVGYKDKIDFEDVNGYHDGNFLGIAFTKESIFEDYYTLYYYLVLKEKSMKKASAIFQELGIDAIKAKGVGIENVYLDSDDFIVAVINPSVLNIVKTEKIYQKDRQINLEY